jgi:hypothetical protein
MGGRCSVAAGLFGCLKPIKNNQYTVDTEVNPPRLAINYSFLKNMPLTLNKTASTKSGIFSCTQTGGRCSVAAGLLAAMGGRCSVAAGLFGCLNNQYTVDTEVNPPRLAMNYSSLKNMPLTFNTTTNTKNIKGI